MAMFESLADAVEVNGESVLAVVDGMGAFRSTGLAILAELGLSDVRPGHWYSQESWLSAFRKISDEIGPNVLYSIGRVIPDNSRFPAEIDSIEAALASIDTAYHMNHRGGEIGHYRFESLGDGSARMVCWNPYPCDFDRGIIEAMAKRFRPIGSLVTVHHETDALCRKNGADSCTYLVQWFPAS